MAGGGQAAPLGQHAGLSTAERALVMVVMAKRAQGPDVVAGYAGCPAVCRWCTFAAQAGEGGLFGGRSLLVEWHGCMMSW